MVSSVFLVFATVLLGSGVLANECDRLGVVLYEDMNCKPIRDDLCSKCPNRFECGQLGDDDSVCIRRGEEIEVGEKFPVEEYHKTCISDCECRTDASQKCTINQCKNDTEVLAPNCYYRYVLDQCCSIGPRCIQPGTEKNLFKCVVDGKSYYEFQKFEPKDSCYECVCQKGFNNQFVYPFCRRKVCNVQEVNQYYVRNNCGPVYLKAFGEPNKKCCPAQWTCQDNTEIILGPKNRSGTSPENACKYGKLLLEIGARFQKPFEINNKGQKFNLLCKCVMPPFVTCSDYDLDV